MLDGTRAPGEQRWDELAILPHSLGLLEELTLHENVTLPLRLRDGPRADPAVLLGRLGIDHVRDRFPAEVSLGEQQRAALARAAIAKPQVLVADEPVAHQVAFAAADRVLHLHDGHLSVGVPSH